ncbi:phage tail tape measure protein [Bacillus sp. FJAT-52991]|uniref:Phage tail tape measure protein n=1 Tax=Bacillus kandeliae TaxID=3129297 RepID=A0ABZ2N2N2_9BACI
MQELFDLFGKIGVDTDSVMKEFDKVEKAGQEAATKMERAFDKLSDELKDIDLSVDMDAKGVLKELEKIEKAAAETETELKALDGKVIDIDVQRALKETKKLEQQAKDLAEQIERDMQLGLDVGNAEAELNGVIAQIKKVEAAAKNVDVKIDVDASGAESAANRVVSALEKVEQKAADIQRTLGEAGESIGQLGESAATATAPLAGMGAAAMMAANNTEAAMGQIQAQTGKTKEEAEALTETAKNLWKQGFGETMTDAAKNIAMVTQNMQGLNGQELEQVTAAAMNLEKIFGVGVEESTRAAGIAMTNFGEEGTHVMDVLTVGLQKAGSQGDDLLDTFQEYSPQFAALGMSSQEAMNLLIQGLDAGARNTDVLADSLKEFTIEAEQSGTRVAEGYEMIGMDGQKMMSDIAAGGDKANDAFFATITALSGIDDELKKNQAGVALFGTKWEDVKSSALLALDPTKDALGEVAGAAEKAGEAVNDNFGTRLASFLRTAQSSLEPFGIALLSIAEDILPILVSALEKATSFFQALPGPVQKAIAIFGLLAVALGPVMMFLGSLMALFSGISGAVGMLSGGIGRLIGLFNGMSGAIARVTSGFKGLGGVLAGIPKIFNVLKSVIMSFGRTLLPLLLNPWTLAIAAIIAAVVGLVYLIVQNWNKISSATRNIFGSIVSFLSNTWNSIVATAKSILSALVSFVIGIFNKIKSSAVNIMSATANGIKMAWNGIVSFFSALLNRLLGVFRAIFTAIKSVVVTTTQAISSFLRMIWSSIYNFLAVTARRIYAAVRSAFLALKNAIVNIVTALWNWLKMIWISIYNFLKNIAIRIKNTVVQAFTAMKNAVISIVNRLKSGVISAFNAVIAGAKKLAEAIMSTVVSAFNAALKAATKFVKKASNLGVDVARGIAKGISSGAKWVMDAMGNLVDDAIAWFKKKFGIHSPSRVMRALAYHVPEGQALGIEDGQPLVEEAMENLTDISAMETDMKWNIHEPDMDFASMIASNIPIDSSFDPNYFQPGGGYQQSGESGLWIEQLILQVQNLPTMQELENLKQQLQNIATDIFFTKATQME